MDEELKQELEWMNTNLNAIVANQAMIYEALKEIEEWIKPKEENG